jgi:hypothetical protein
MGRVVRGIAGEAWGVSSAMAVGANAGAIEGRDVAVDALGSRMRGWMAEDWTTAPSLVLSFEDPALAPASAPPPTGM